MVAANPAGVRTVTNIEEHPGPGEPAAVGRKVTAKLNSPGFIDGGTREKMGYTREAVIDVTGAWSLILEVNADIDPPGTTWTVKEPGNRTWIIEVLAGDPAVPVTLRSCIVTDPQNPNPVVGVSSVDGQTGNVDLTNTYVALADVSSTTINYAGSGPPSAGLGFDGDTYIDTLNLVFYSAKSGSDWSGSTQTFFGSPIGAAYMTGAVVNSVPTITVASPWGINSHGAAYFDPAGAAAGQAAVPVLGLDGSITLVQPMGEVA